MAFQRLNREGAAAPARPVAPLPEVEARPLPHRAKDGPRFETALFEIGMKIGQLPADLADMPREIVESLIYDLADLEHDVRLLADPECHSERRPQGERPRVFMWSQLNQVGTFRTVLSLVGDGADDFIHDPRRHSGDNRPIDEVFRTLKADALYDEDGGAYGGLRSDLATLVLAAHRKAWGIVRERLDLVVVNEPIAVEQPDGSRALDIDRRSVLDAEEARAQAAAVVAKAEAVLSAFENTFPGMRPETFSEIYRSGQSRKHRSAQIAAALAEGGAPPNDTGTKSVGMRDGSRKFTYCVNDLSGASKQLETALDLVRPDWREKTEPALAAPAP